MPPALICLQFVFVALVFAMLISRQVRRKWFTSMGNKVWDECLQSPPADYPAPEKEPPETNLNVIKFPRLGPKLGRLQKPRAKLTAGSLYWNGERKLEFMMKEFDKTHQVDDIELTCWIAVPMFAAVLANVMAIDTALIVLYIGSFLFALKVLIKVLVGEGRMLSILRRLDQMEKKYPIATYGFVPHRMYMLGK